MFWLLAAFGVPAEPGYIAPEACRSCHAKIYESYSQTGMARGFAPAGTVAGPQTPFFHRASGRYYEVLLKDGAAFLRRYQDGPTNVLEKRIDYVVGSGNHSRTYLHRKPDGRLIELPLSWYAEGGGRWAMSPGYDTPDHADFRREVSGSCLFCHNGYPSMANRGLAHGIDCQRCHGPGEAHVRRKGAIVNPAKLSPERQMEVCMQCHLESTSRRVPYAIRRYDRGPFSYRPGEPLGNFALHFDEPGGQGDRFEVNHSAYRLRSSRCFLESKEKLTCTTCHNPHEAMRGEAAQTRFTQICRSCHSSAHSAQTAACAGCHMPKRRTEDAVHIVMTDHRIQRKAGADLLRPLVEARGRYEGEVALYYPPGLPDTPENRLYLALAQLKEFTNLNGGIGMLERAIAAARPRQAEFYLDLAEAYWRAGKFDDAAGMYRQAIGRKPDFTKAHAGLGETLLRLGRVDEAIAVLGQAVRKTPDAALLNTLAVAYGQKGRIPEALELLRKAVRADPDQPSTWVNLGVAREHSGDAAGARAAYREALRLQPDFEEARRRLGRLD